MRGGRLVWLERPQVEWKPLSKTKPLKGWETTALPSGWENVSMCRRDMFHWECVALPAAITLKVVEVAMRL